MNLTRETFNVMLNASGYGGKLKQLCDAIEEKGYITLIEIITNTTSSYNANYRFSLCGANLFLKIYNSSSSSQLYLETYRDGESSLLGYASYFMLTASAVSVTYASDNDVFGWMRACPVNEKYGSSALIVTYAKLSFWESSTLTNSLAVYVASGSYPTLYIAPRDGVNTYASTSALQSYVGTLKNLISSENAVIFPVPLSSSYLPVKGIGNEYLYAISQGYPGDFMTVGDQQLFCLCFSSSYGGVAVKCDPQNT